MVTPDLFYICITAFIAVFVLLSVLAGMIKLINYLYPEKVSTDAAIIAAINTTYQSIYPGTKVSKIEEVK